MAETGDPGNDLRVVSSGSDFVVDVHVCAVHANVAKGDHGDVLAVVQQLAHLVQVLLVALLPDGVVGVHTEQELLDALLRDVDHRFDYIQSHTAFPEFLNRIGYHAASLEDLLGLQRHQTRLSGPHADTVQLSGH